MNTREDSQSCSYAGKPLAWKHQEVALKLEAAWILEDKTCLVKEAISWCEDASHWDHWNPEKNPWEERPWKEKFDDKTMLGWISWYFLKSACKYIPLLFNWIREDYIQSSRSDIYSKIKAAKTEQTFTGSIDDAWRISLELHLNLTCKLLSEKWESAYRDTYKKESKQNRLTSLGYLLNYNGHGIEGVIAKPFQGIEFWMLVIVRSALSQIRHQIAHNPEVSTSRLRSIMSNLETNMIQDARFALPGFWEIADEIQSKEAWENVGKFREANKHQVLDESGLLFGLTEAEMEKRWDTVVRRSCPAAHIYLGNKSAVKILYRDIILPIINGAWFDIRDELLWIRAEPYDLDNDYWL